MVRVTERWRLGKINYDEGQKGAEIVSKINRGNDNSPRAAIKSTVSQLSIRKLCEQPWCEIPCRYFGGCAQAPSSCLYWLVVPLATSKATCSSATLEKITENYKSVKVQAKQPEKIRGLTRKYFFHNILSSFIQISEEVGHSPQKCSDSISVKGKCHTSSAANIDWMIDRLMSGNDWLMIGHALSPGAQRLLLCA